MGVKAAPDGYSLHIPGSGSMAIAPAMYKSLSYDPVKDIAPIALIGRVPFVLIVNPSLPVKSIPELIQYAKEHKLNYASGGPGCRIISTPKCSRGNITGISGNASTLSTKRLALIKQAVPKHATGRDAVEQGPVISV